MRQNLRAKLRAKSNNSLKKQFSMVSKLLQISEGQLCSENHSILHIKNSLDIVEKLDLQIELDLISFAKFSERNKVVQEEISNCDNSQKLEKILKKYECEFNIEDIEKRSRDLAASYWPWHKKTSRQRKAFFMKE